MSERESPPLLAPSSTSSSEEEEGDLEVVLEEERNLIFFTRGVREKCGGEMRLRVGGWFRLVSLFVGVCLCDYLFF